MTKTVRDPRVSNATSTSASEYGFVGNARSNASGIAVIPAITGGVSHSARSVYASAKRNQAGGTMSDPTCSTLYASSLASSVVAANWTA